VAFSVRYDLEFGGSFGNNGWEFRRTRLDTHRLRMLRLVDLDGLIIARGQATKPHECPLCTKVY
jgi:hypothetical protein